MGLAELLYQALGGALPLRFELYDGSTAGPPDAKVRTVVRSPEGLARFVSRPGELGIVRAYVSGDVDIDGDLFTGLEQAAGLDLRLPDDRPGRGRPAPAGHRARRARAPLLRPPRRSASAAGCTAGAATEPPSRTTTT